MDTGNFNWEYEAPRFVDFEANEHLCDNADDYFDRVNKSNSLSELFDEPADSDKPDQKSLHGVHFKESIEKSPTVDTSDPLSSFPQTPSRETYGVKTPSRVLRSSVKKQSLHSSTSGLNKGAPIKFGEISTVQASSSASQTLSNVMTPSRLDSWKPGPTKFNAGRCDPKPANRRSTRRSIGKKPLPVSDTSMPPTKKAKKAVSKIHLTTPSTAIPHGHTKHARHPTSEERELAQIKQMRQDAKQAKKERQNVVKRLERQGTNNMSGVSNKPHTTQTKEFHFRTDERAAKTHHMLTRSDSDKPSDFESKLRKYAPSPAKKSRTTVAKPFNLTTKRKRDNDGHEPGERKPFMPMAQAIMDFHKRTPQRFHVNKAKKFDHEPVKPLVYEC